MHIEKGKKNCCWQEELSVWIAAEVNCLVSVMEYNSYNSIWAAATNKLIKTVSWDKASISVWLPQMSGHIHLITGTGNPIPLDVLVWQWGARVGCSHREDAEAPLADSWGVFSYQQLSGTFVDISSSCTAARHLTVLIGRNGPKETLVSHEKQLLNEKWRSDIKTHCLKCCRAAILMLTCGRKIFI